MAPNVPSASSACDIWTSVKENNTANDTAHFNHFNNNNQCEAISNKRLKIDPDESSIAPLNINNNIVVNVPSPISCGGIEDKNVIKNNFDGGKLKNRRLSGDTGKIKDETTKVNKNGIKTCEKSVGCVAKPKTDRNRHQGKITEYFKSQIKPLVGVKRDFNYLKKDIFQSVNKRADNSKTLAVTNKLDEPTSKKVKCELVDKDMDVPVFVKPSPKPVQTVMPFPEPPRHPTLAKLPNLLTKPPPETKTLFNKILQNHKNRKLAENYMKNRTTSLKPKTADNEVLKPSHNKPYESSTRNSNIITEMPNKSTKIDELSSNLDEKVQNIKLDSNLLNVDSKKTDLVNCEVVISSNDRPDAVESSKSSSASSSPILSAPTTIRFPANCHNDRDNKHGTRETVYCRWDACSVQFDSASGLLEHLQVRKIVFVLKGTKPLRRITKPAPGGSILAGGMPVRNP